MKYLIIKLMICSFFSAFGQKDLKYPLAIEAHFGLNTAQIKNSESLIKTVSSTSSGLGATYYFSKFIYVQTGISVLEDVSLSNLNFDTFKIPLSVGTSIKLDGAPYFVWRIGWRVSGGLSCCEQLRGKDSPKKWRAWISNKIGDAVSAFSKNIFKNSL
jgi:hypothetical protein